jgi:hypothetical protein
MDPSMLRDVWVYLDAGGSSHVYTPATSSLPYDHTQSNILGENDVNEWLTLSRDAINF